MTAPTITELLKYADLQMAAEAFVRNPLTNFLEGSGRGLIEALMAGNGHTSRFTLVQATEFESHWEVLDQQPNTSTGFSGTLFRNKDTNELVMSFRSTEFIDDAARDNQSTNRLEIQETGFAWGQIRDMQAWYQQLCAAGGPLSAGQAFSVTGYSLGGHLATVFNLMHGTQTVTFNGAGIGLIDSSTTLQKLVDTFTTLSANADGNAFTFANSALTELYARTRAAYKAGGSISAADLSTLISLANPPAEGSIPPDGQAKMILEAISRIDNIRAEVNRLTSITSGDGNSPVRVPNGSIGQQDLDYQMAVLTVKASTDAGSLLDGLSRTYGDKVYINPASLLPNQFDVVGDTSPSAVSNSLWHAAADVRIFIEDQPLFRGGIGGDAAMASFANFDVKLIVDGYAKKDFGDTHSLVLLVDSLNVQNTILQMLPENQRSGAAATLKQTLLAASNLRRVDGALLVGLDQGKAEGDVLENVLNALADLAIGPRNFTPLKGSPDGGTWAEITGPAGYSGRDDFYALLKQIQDSSLFKNAAAGGVTLELKTVSVDLATQAHTDFGAFAALYSRCPFVLNQGGTALENAVGELWGDTYTRWKDDKDALAQGDPDPALNFTDEWLRDRADLLVRTNYFNVNDTSYDSTQPGAYAKLDSLGNAIATAYDSEDIVWQDRQTDLTIQRGGLTQNTRYVVFGSEQNEVNIVGGSRNDSLYGGGGDDVVKGQDGEDYLEGNAGNDTLDGGKGIDTLLGGSGDDTMTGGESSDFLYGGLGYDIYHFTGNVGIDMIRDADGLGGIVVGAPGSAPLTGGKKLAENVWISDDRQFTFALVEGNLVVRFGENSGAAGIVTLQAWKPGELGINLSDELAAPAPTNTLTGDFAKKLNDAQTQYVLGTDGNYQSNGDSPGALDLIKAGDAGALIRGLGGQDALFGGNGNDILEGGEGGDVLFGSLGSDTLRGGAGTDFLFGSDKGSIAFPLTVQAPPAGALSDTWIPGFNWVFWRNGTLSGFPAWAYSDDLQIAAQAADAGNVIEGGAGDDQVWAGTGSDVVHGDAGVDVIWGVGGNDILYGDGEDDAIAGNAGQDIIAGGDGNDLLLGYGNDDAVYGGAGNDTLYGDDRLGIENISGRGNDYLDGGAGDDALYGNEGDDILIGGAGNDLMQGGAGKDIYLISKGDGVDTIVDTRDGNVFRFGAGVLRDSIKLRLGSLLLDLGGGDQVHIEGFNPADAVNSVAIESFEFADGSVLTSADLLARGFDIDGTADDDSLVGTSVDDRINGYAGDDTLTAGPGADTLAGGEGSDTFVINAGDGPVTITDAGATDLIQFGADLSLAALSGTFTAHSMAMTFASGQSVTVTGNASMRFADGATVTNLYDASGNAAGSSVRTEDADGSLTTFHAGQNGTGARLGDTWTTVLGGQGSDTFNADGSRSGVAYYLDGSYSTYTDDGAGTRVDETFDASGFETGDRWVHPDGSWGTDVFYANGSSTGVVHNADGSYAIYDNDGHGHVLTTTYDAAGHPLALDDGTQTYPRSTRTQYADGSYRVTEESAPGVATSTLFAAGGAKLGRSWTQDDGSHGVETFLADGSSDGVIYQPDGAYQTLHADGRRQTLVKSYTARGVLTGTAITEVDGLNSITTFLNAAGTKISESWVHGDGSAGNDLIGPLDYNGLPNLVAGTLAHSMDFYRAWAAPDGAAGNYRYDSGSYFGSWMLSDISGMNDPFGEFRLKSWSSTEKEGSYLAWLHEPGQPSARFYIDAWFQTPAMAAYDTHKTTGNYRLIDYATGVNVSSAASATGRKYFTIGGQWTDIGAIGKPVTTTFTGYGGAYDIFEDDGQGNVVLTGYSAGSVKIGALWFHNDGSYGMETWQADGSRSGAVINPGESYLRYVVDAQGQLTSTIYPGASASIHRQSYAPPPPEIAPPPPPPRNSAPSGGQAQDVTYTTPAGDGSTTITSRICEESVWFDSSGKMVVKATSFTDPGYDAAVAYGDGFAGWTYYDTGLPIARYIDDGHGTVETFTYDARQRISGRNVAVTASDGTVTTKQYTAGGQLTGITVQTHPAADQIDIASYDAAGRLTGRSQEFLDGQGNSVVSRYDAAGALLSFTAKVVSSDGWRTTFTGYDAAGVATGVIVSTTSASGVIQTDNYDAAGHLIGSVVATPDGAGKVETVNYDARGAILSYFDLEITQDRTAVLTMHDAQGRMVREDFLQANGLHANTEYSPDGASVTTTTAMDGSFSTLERDPLGNQTTTRFAADGTRLGDTWTRGDGSYGADTFGADGSSSGTATYADGSTCSSVTTASGDTTITRRSAAGAVTGTTVTTHLADETRLISYDAQGHRLSEVWWRSNGSGGQGTPVADQAATEDEGWSFMVPAFASLAGGAPAYAASLASGLALPSWLSFDAATRTFSGTPANGDVGILPLKIIATDSAGASAITGFQLAVANVNDAPTAPDTLVDWSATAGHTVSYVVPEAAFGDIDADDTLQYNATLGNGAALPSWLSFDPATLTFSGTPAKSDGGDLVLKIIATDTAGLSASQTIALHVEVPVAVPLDEPVDVPVDPNPGLTLTGTIRNDKLVGGAGDDTLDGGAGKDQLAGGAGNDTYVMARGYGADKIEENDATEGNHDVVRLGDDIRIDQLWFQKRGHDLQVSVIGTRDKLTIAKWFEGAQHHIEEFRTSDGKVLLDSQVQDLVDAMTEFSPPHMGQTTLPHDYQQQLAGMIAANWH